MAWAADVHSALQLVQVFRECQNAVHTIEANVAALSNISQQKRSLEGAMRRRKHCFESFKACDDRHAPERRPHEEVGEDSTAPTALSTSLTKTTRVATPPLGVLVAFTTATSEALLGQHQEDQQELLTSMHQAEQKWSQRVERAKQLVADLETRVVSTSSGASVTPDQPAAAPNAKKQTESAKRKAAAAAYMESFYGANTPAVGSTSAVSPSSTRPREMRAAADDAARTFYQQRTGLPSQGALFEACRGMTAVLMRMLTALQELTLALRSDLMRTLSEARTAAVAVSAWLDACLCDAATARPTVVAARTTTPTEGEEKTMPATATAQPITVAPHLVGAPHPTQQLLTWEDALMSVEEAIPRHWQRWKDLYLTEESYLLLAA